MSQTVNHTERLNREPAFIGRSNENEAEEYLYASFLNKEDEDTDKIKTKGKKLINALDKFNKTNNLSVFNQWLSLRSKLEKTNPSKLAQYDNLVNHVKNEIKMEVSDEELNIDDANKDEYKEIGNREPLQNEGIKSLIAARLVDQYFNRPEILEGVTHKGLSIGLFTITDNEPNDDKGVSGVYYSDGSNTLAVDPRYLVTGVINPNDQNDVLAHEFAHAVDDISGGVDGLLPSMTPEEKENFLKGREALFNNKENSKIRQYGFSKQEEFLTVTIEAFRENPGLLWNESPDLYLAYASYFKTDPLGKANFAIASNNEQNNKDNLAIAA